MKIKLKNPSAAPSDAPAPPANGDAVPAPALAAAKTGGFKLKLKPAAPAAPTADGDAPKQKRKYTKKTKVDADGNAVSHGKPGPKKRVREDGEDGEAPTAKRKPKPTLKSLERVDESDDEDMDEPTVPVQRPPPQFPPNRSTSLKLSIKPKSSSSGAPAPSRGTTLLKVKGAGRPPVRPLGVGYDSEADEAEIDPAIESQFVLRMLPGPDCDLLRKSIEEKTIGRTVMQGGPGVHFRFFDKEGRRAMVTIQGRHYAASMVELPNIIESMKSWNKKDWVKTADVCQMLLVLGRVQNEEEAKKFPRPGYVDENSHRYPHGLTPPMRWVRKRRFRPRKSYLDVERAEAEMNALLEADDMAENTKYDLVEEGAESSEEESGSEDGEDEEMMNAPAETPVEEVDAADLEEMLAAGFMDDDNVEIQANDDELAALFGGDALEGQTPVTAHDAAMHALAQNGSIVVEPETVPTTPAAATSAEEDDDDDDDDDDDSDIDEAAAAEQQRREVLETEIAELEKAVQQSIESRDKQNNPLFRNRINKTIERQQQDLHIKKKQLNELNGNEDVDD
jgi:transcription initiation factor TFIID subunit 7